MTQGSAYRLILMFTMPLLIGNVLQQLYNMVDSIVVGNLIGEKALAGVGTGFPVIFMLSSMFMGLGNGATVMISQYYGAKDMQKLRDTVDTIYTTMLVGGVPLTIIGVVLSGPLLRLMQVPDDGTFALAQVYMITIFAGIIGTLGYNANAGILQGLGDSRTSLLFLAIAAVLNIVLDLAFVMMGMGVFGVAFATILAQISSWIFGIIYINRHYTFLRIQPFRFRFHKDLFRRVMKLGIPSGIQQTMFSIGAMVMQSLVNGYGSTFMAGYMGANKIDTFAFLPIQSIANAMTTYVGQNVGAGKLDRVKLGTRAGMVLAVGGSFAIGVLLYPFSGVMMELFNRNPAVIASGVAYLHCVLPFFWLLAIQFVLSSVLRGAGEMIVPMVASIVSLWLMRVPVAYLIAGVWGRDYIYLSYAVGWLTGVAITYFSYRRGAWKRRVLAPAAPEPEAAG